jgi:hypothetical protein
MYTKPPTAITVPTTSKKRLRQFTYRMQQQQQQERNGKRIVSRRNKALWMDTAARFTTRTATFGATTNGKRKKALRCGPYFRSHLLLSLAL